MSTFIKQRVRQYSVPISKVVAVCGLSLVCSRVSAQQGFEFGLRYMVQESALLNRSDTKAGPELDYANTLSFLTGGVAAGYKFDKHLGVEVDVLFSRQGQIYSGKNMEASDAAAYNTQVALQAFLNNSTTVGEYQAKAELNCIKIPFLFKLTTNNTKKLYYTLSAGPQVNILKTAVYELNHTDVVLPGTNITPNDVYRKVTLDGVLALGAGLNLSRHFALVAQARFDYGFQDVEKKDATFSYMGSPEQKYYGDGRAATHNATAALLVGLNYKL